MDSKSNKPRVVSLISSATEMVDALGCRPLLVGRSHECDFPESVKALPQCTEPKFLLDGTSYEIDQRIKAILQEGLSVYRVFASKLDSLKPDLILTQTQCEVCAVSERDVEAAVCELIGSKPKIVSLHPETLEDVFKDLKTVGAALGVEEKAEAVVSALKSRMALIEKCVEASSIARMRVAFIEWIDPLMTGGNWMPELIERAGAQNLFGVNGKHSPYLEWDALVKADPDVIVISPCGFDIARTKKEMPTLVKRPHWKNLKAVREGRVAVADGNQFFNRPGPRVVESLEILAEIFHPEVFGQTHRERGDWEWFT